ncbi:MAG: hypothetical protein L0I76_35945 [Pseudonocardia sp.]|nr:hypothetical protein [Pseudonocardia sp.]
MLPFPLIVRTVGGGLSDDRAYLWHTPAQVQPPQPVIQPAAVARTLRHLLTATAPDGRLPTAEVRDAMRVTSFMDAHGSVRPDSFRDMAAMGAAAGTPLPAAAGRLHPNPAVPAPRSARYWQHRWVVRMHNPRGGSPRSS